MRRRSTFFFQPKSIMVSKTPPFLAKGLRTDKRPTLSEARRVPLCSRDRQGVDQNVQLRLARYSSRV